ncbi:hypothetical protein ACFL47_08980 [Candidatus Latescibacterota bacterium]
MNKLLIVLFVSLFFGVVFFGCESADRPIGVTAPDGISLAKKTKNDGCATIKDGTLLSSAGDPLVLGYDDWGYNYQAHLFNGLYCDSYRDAAWCQEWKDVNLQMKWNEAWLSNKDCDGDGKLDRHYGFDSYIGSGAWLTNHQSGIYGDDGTEWDGKKWTYFTKIVAAPADANKVGGVWYTADGTEIGPAIWGDFATIQEILNDPGEGTHGIQYRSPAAPGFGKYKP